MESYWLILMEAQKKRSKEERVWAGALELDAKVGGDFVIHNHSLIKVNMTNLQFFSEDSEKMV